MHIVKKADESRIAKATQMAGEKSEKLADTIKDILALKGKDILSVEIIEDAIDIVDGKKKPTDLIPCLPLKKATRIKHKHGLLRDIAIWFVPNQEPKGTLWTFAEEPRKTWISCARELSKASSYICAKERVSEENDVWYKPKMSSCYIVRIMQGRAQMFAWDHPFKESMIHTDFKHDRLSERSMLLVRNR